MESKGHLLTQNYAADIQSIKEAQLRISPYIHRTPVLSSSALDSMAGRQLFFKCECFQKGGAFKIRGASNAIFSLEDNEVDKGVLTHSSGNYAAAVSLAANLRGIPAYIVILKNAPKCKVENVKRYGGQVIWSEATLESRGSTANKVQKETGAVLIHPFNDKRIISGRNSGINLGPLVEVANYHLLEGRLLAAPKPRKASPSILRFFMLDKDLLIENRLTLRAMSEFGAFLVFYYVCDRTDLFGESKRVLKRMASYAQSSADYENLSGKHVI